MIKYCFSEAKNTMVITTKSIINNIKYISLVSHDDDGMWEFLDGDDVDEEDAAIVSLFEIVKIDDSINDLCELPTGWIAYRECKDGKWVKQVN
jgi:hypothetical protein